MKDTHKVFNTKEINYDLTTRGINNRPTTEKGLVLERHLNKDQGFMKIAKSDVVKDHLKEAKRVKYIVEKDDMSFYVNDDETGELVMKGIMVGRNIYAITFNNQYWQDPVPLVLSANDLEEKRIELSI